MAGDSKVLAAGAGLGGPGDPGKVREEAERYYRYSTVPRSISAGTLCAGRYATGDVAPAAA